MTDQQFGATVAPAPVGQQAIAGIPRRRLDAVCRFFALPGENFVGDFRVGAPGGDRLRFRSGFPAQAMIDGERRQHALTFCRPVPGKRRQNHAVGAAREAHGNTRLRRKRSGSGHQISKFIRCKSASRGSAQRHLARCCSR